MITSDSNQDLHVCFPICQVWSCGQCFSMFHINCIQKWARDGAIQTSNLSQENFPAVELSWFWYVGDMYYY